jgi:hypothetical protein
MTFLDVESPLGTPPGAPPQEQPRPQGNGQAAAQPQPQAAPPPPPAEPVPQAEEIPEDAGKPPEPWVTWEPGKCTLRLRKEVVAHGEKVMKLTFKEPTGGDIERVGNPVAMGAGGIHFEAPIMSAMMSHLAGVPTSTIRMMHSKDWSNAAFTIWGFFVPDV